MMQETGYVQGEAEEPVYIIRPRNYLRRFGLTELFQYKHLIRYLILRSVRGRYRPTMLGYGWVVMRPALLCLVYWFAVGFLFKVDSKPIPFPLFLFLGVSCYLFFSSGLMDTTASLSSNAGMMSKVYYPRLVAPLASMGVNLLDFGASLAIVFGLMLLYRVPPPLEHMLFFPLFLFGFVCSTFALGVIFAARTVKVRDIMMILPVSMRVLIYSMPAVYPIERIPAKLQPIYYLNPFATFLQGMRWSLLGDSVPPLWSVLWAVFLMLAALVIGLLSFAKVERTMVDSL